MLMALPEGGAIIDSPGMRELGLWASEEALDEVFRDVSTLAGRCRFGDCTHTSEPGCTVRAALESGEMDVARWQSYRKLEAELQHQRLQQDAQAKAAEKKKWKAIHKAMRDHPKYRR
jgi:ribosome biogenesis GTPase